ncbi:MAG TPA: ROK family protein [Chitinophagaceae bacterium]|nr:ROK family protein [Chitinophagaceae bacterium]
MLWGIDLGGTKIEGVILPSLDDVKPLLRTRIDTEAYNGYDHVLNQVGKLVGQMIEMSGITPKAIGIGTPGVVDPVTMGMKNCNSVILNGRPLRQDLENLLGIDVVIANDANCFALAENHWGIVKEQYPQAKVVFGIIMGTGVGGGIVIDGKVWNGHHGIAGEWGHNFLDDSGGPCYCGKIGCVETVLLGPGLQRYYASLTGDNITLKEIVKKEKEGNDAAAAKTLERLAHNFGKAVSVITNLLDPDVIVVGGGVGNIDVIYDKGCEWLKYFIFNNGVEVPVVKPLLGDSAGVFGAAALVAGY